MAGDTLTVGESRMLVEEVLTSLGVQRSGAVVETLPGDDNPITIESFRKVMREGLGKVFASVLHLDLRGREILVELSQREEQKASGLSVTQAELERLRQQPEQILLDLGDDMVVEPHRRVLEGLAVLLDRADGPGPNTFDSKSWATLTDGLSTAIGLCLKAQDATVNQARERCKGGESNG